MPIALRAWMGPINHVLDGGPELQILHEKGHCQRLTTTIDQDITIVKQNGAAHWYESVHLYLTITYSLASSVTDSLVFTAETV